MWELINDPWLWIVMIAQFFAVSALVMNSKLLRDDRWKLAMCNSWLISVTQFIFIYVVSHSTEPVTTFFFAAFGGSMGCGAAHLLYTRVIMDKSWRSK